MKILPKVAASMLLAIFSLPALADSGWYVAADVGQSHFTGGQFDAYHGALTTKSMSDSSTGYRLTGGYQFTPNWGLEAGYVDLGHGTATYTYQLSVVPDVSSRTQYRIGAKGLFVAGTGTYPITEQWSLYGRVGAVDGQLDIQAQTNGNINLVGGSDTSWKGTYGVGAKWNFMPQLSLRLGWDRYLQLGPSSPSISQYDVSLLSLGVEWRFF